MFEVGTAHGVAQSFQPRMTVQRKAAVRSTLVSIGCLARRTASGAAASHPGRGAQESGDSRKWIHDRPSGELLLAFRPPRDAAKPLDGYRVTQHTANTTTMHRLDAELQRRARTGYAQLIQKADQGEGNAASSRTNPS